MKKTLIMLLVVVMMLSLAACRADTPAKISIDDNSTPAVSSNNYSNPPITVKPSPDKYTWYIKNYVGKNCASIGYTTLGGVRMDKYGAGMLRLILVSADGSYIDIGSNDVLKKYSVTGQNIAPNTELKLVLEKDSEGNEYDHLVASQSFEEIVLSVKKVGDSQQNTVNLTAITPSPDKYTRYIADYTGRNLANCGYVSLAGNLMDRYGSAFVKLIIVAEDGAYIDPFDTELLKTYVVTGQNIAPNTELNLIFEKNSEGVEYDNIVKSQNIEEVEVYVKYNIASTEDIEVEPTTKSIPDKNKPMVDGMRLEFKEAMDSYEAFYNKYCDFMKEYKTNPTDPGLLAEYSDLMSKAVDADEKFEAWDEGDMNTEELKYYLDVNNRVMQKLLKVTQ